MTESLTKVILSLHEEIRKTYPQDVVGGHINQQAIDGIVANVFLMYGGKPIHDTIFKQAAALMEGIIRLHPFPDGNKRTALLTASMFLLIRDHYLVTPLDTIRFMVGVAENEGRTGEEIAELTESVASWLKERTATTVADHEALVRKYLAAPARKLFLISLTVVGIIYVHYKLKYWLASDMHPQYAKDKLQTMRFLLDLTFGLGRLLKQKENMTDSSEG